MSCNSLPGISSIKAILCSHLSPDLMLQAITGCTVTITAPVIDVDYLGIPTLSWSGSIVNGQRQEKSTLEFKTRSVLPEGVNLAFVVSAASGEQFLIGTLEPRFPVISYSQTTGSPSGEPAIRTYKITHIAQMSVLPCIL